MSLALLFVGLILVGAALAIRTMADFAAPPQEPTVETQAALPLPADTFTGSVLDPASAPISAAMAIGIARDSPSGLVGEAPLARLMHVRDSSPESVLTDFTGWVVLSSDVYVPLYGGHDAPTIRPAVSYGWVFVDLDGRVVAAIAISYARAEDAPALPSQ